VVRKIPKKTIMFWLGMMIVFLLTFMLGYLGLKTGTGILNIMPVTAENFSIMFLSVLGMFKSIYEIF